MDYPSEPELVLHGCVGDFNLARSATCVTVHRVEKSDALQPINGCPASWRSYPIICLRHWTLCAKGTFLQSDMVAHFVLEIGQQAFNR